MNKNSCPLFPMKREHPLDPPSSYASFRKAKPIKKARLWNGTTTWLATRYDDVRAVLHDGDAFSTEPDTPGYPMIAPSRGEVLLAEKPSLMRMDPPEHTPFRRMLMKEFTVKRIQEMRPELEQIVDRLLDDMERQGSSVDLMKAVALPLPTIVISKMLGIPYEDHEFLQERTDTKANIEVDAAIAAAAQRDLDAYIDKVMREKEATGGSDDDLLSRLVRDQIVPGHLSHDEAVATAQLLIEAGHETTASTIGLGMLTLFQNPDQMELLTNNRTLMGNAIEEMLRFLTPPHLVGARVAIKDVELSGQVIKAGESVWALLPAANRDPMAFPDPEKFDITRDAKHHVTFGFGVHQCLGQGLSRLELEIVFNRLLDRFPKLQLAIPFDEISFKHDSFVFGLNNLPVKW